MKSAAADQRPTDGATGQPLRAVTAASIYRNDHASAPDMLSHATYDSLAAAIQTPTLAVCAWCRVEFPQANGVGVFCSLYCSHAEMAGGTGVALRSAHQIEQGRRAASTALCTCGDQEREHGTISRACLKRKGGRFDGASDQRRCRCKGFVAAEQPDTLATDLLQSLVLAQGKTITAQAAAITQLRTDVDALMQAVTG